LMVAWVPTLATVIVVIYVTFSWEQWWYGGGFSARPLISLYPLLALSLASLLAQAQANNRIGNGLLRGVLMLGILLNLWQTWQYGAGTLHWDNITAESYFANFFTLKY